MLFKTLLTASLSILSSALVTKAWDSDPKVHEVIVGGAAGLVYTPNQVWAKPGEKVKFTFQFKNHTVTQSSFDKPCDPLKGGFDSGFNPVAVDAKDFPTFVIEVKDEEPIWVHCEQVDHCPSGMVFAVNAPKEGNTFDKFLEKAKETGKDGYKDGGSYDDGHKDGGSYDDGNKDGGSYDDGHKDGGSYDDGHKDGGSYDDGHKDGGSYDDGHKDGGSYDDGHKDGGSYDDGHKDGGSYDDGNKDGGSYKRRLLSRIIGKRNFVEA